MKRKLLSFLLISVLLLSISGCGVSFDPNEIEYTAYSYSSAGLVASTESNGNSSSLHFASASDLKLSIDMHESEKMIEDAEKNKSIAFQNQSFEATYVRSKVLPTQNSKQSTLQKNSLVDEYQKDKKTIQFRHSTGEMIGYYEGDKSIRSVSGDLTLEEAEALAAQLLTELYGKDVLDEYTLGETQRIQSYWRVTYTRYLFGYPTEDEIRVHFNLKGELIFLKATYMGNYQHLEDEISKEHVEYAEELLRSSISSSWTVADYHRLVLDADGNCYVKLLAARKTCVVTGSGAEFYINVN